MGCTAVTWVLGLLQIAPFKSKDKPVELSDLAITRVFHISFSSLRSVGDNYSSSGWSQRARWRREAQVICVELVEHSKSQSELAIMMIVYQSMQRFTESTDYVTHYVMYDLWNCGT